MTVFPILVGIDLYWDQSNSSLEIEAEAAAVAAASKLNDNSSKTKMLTSMLSTSCKRRKCDAKV